METIKVEINVTTSAGRKLMREIEKYPQLAKIEYPLPLGIMDTTYTVDESYDECCEILSEHFKCDVRKL